MIQRPPRLTRTDTLFPYTTLFRSMWNREWGVADPATAVGGLSKPEIAPPARQVTLLQRKAESLGKRLGKTTGWIHRTTLKKKQVEMIGGVNYEARSEEHTSELQSLMRISYAAFCLKKNTE